MNIKLSTEPTNGFRHSGKTEEAVPHQPMADEASVPSTGNPVISKNLDPMDLDDATFAAYKQGELPFQDYPSTEPEEASDPSAHSSIKEGEKPRPKVEDYVDSMDLDDTVFAARIQRRQKEKRFPGMDEEEVDEKGQYPELTNPGDLPPGHTTGEKSKARLSKNEVDKGSVAGVIRLMFNILSPLSKYHDELKRLRLWTLTEVISLTGSKAVAEKEMRMFVEKGLALCIQRGLYAYLEKPGGNFVDEPFRPTPVGKKEKQQRNQDLDFQTPHILASKFEIATALAKGAFVCRHAALEAHGFNRYHVRDIEVCTPSRFRAFRCGSFNFQHCRLPKPYEGIVYLSPKHPAVRATDLERTIVDCVQARPNTFDWFRFYVTLADIDKPVDMDKLYRYATFYDRRSLFRKLTFICTVYGKIWGQPYSKNANNFIWSSGNSKVYLVNREGPQHYCTDMKLYIPTILYDFLQKKLETLYPDTIDNLFQSKDLQLVNPSMLKSVLDSLFFKK